MDNQLKKEFLFYIKNQNNLVKQYQGKVIVIKNQKVIGAYDDELEAIDATVQEHELGTFLVQKCEPGEQNYTQTFHSRVMFG